MPNALIVRHNDIAFKDLPPRFDGFTILHISDLHVDISEAAMRRVHRARRRLALRHLRSDRRLSRQDLRAVRGDPGRASGGCEPTSRGRSTACWAITIPSGWFPGWKPWESGCCSTSARRSRATISASFWPASTTRTSTGWTTSKRPSAQIPDGAFSILLSHTPEIYRQAAHAAFQADAERTYPWRPDLPARVDSDYRWSRSCRDGWGRAPGSITR